MERFLQYSLLGMAASGFFALAGARPLDRPTLILTLAALLLRALSLAGWLRFVIPAKAISLAAAFCAAFFLLDFYFLSRNFFTSTLHGICFLTAIKILTAKTSRDFLYIAGVAFLQLAGASMISFQANFFLWLALYILFAVASLTSAEILAGIMGSGGNVQSRSGSANGRLAALAFGATICILAISAALFLALPRTARAAATLLPDSLRFTGYSSVVDLGGFGSIARDTRPVMHVLSYAGALPQSLKWRGTALSRFDGRRWSEPPLAGQDIAHNGTVEVAGPLQRSRLDAKRLLYRVNVASSDTGTLFIAGIPEFINVSAPRLIRTAEDSFRVLPVTGEPLEYEVSAHPGPQLATGLSSGERTRYLQIPIIDSRIPALAVSWAGRQGPMESALLIQQHLRHDFAYRLEGSGLTAKDPLANFLFVTKRGYCEYFASAMAVMLRARGIPSRIVTGFQSGYFNDVSKLYVVRASDAHAWVEAWLDGRGWVTFDPTPFGAAPDPGWLGRMGVYLDAADSMWQQWVVSYDTGRQALLASDFADRIRKIEYGRRGTREWGNLLPLRAAKWGGIAAAFAGLALAAIQWLPGLLRNARTRVRIQRIARRGGSPGDGRALYEHMLKAMERRGYRKPPWFTPLEFARGMPPAENERVARFTFLYNSLRFGGDTAAAAELAALLRDL